MTKHFEELTDRPQDKLQLWTTKAASRGINDRRAMAETVARHSKKPDGKTGEENDVKKEVEMSTPAAAGSRLSIFSSKERKHS